MAGETLTLTRPIPLEEEIDGDRDGTSDFVFVRIGESLPLKPSDSAFDPEDPPSRPLAVSERHGLLFLAHSQGFFVARSKDVIGAAKEIKEKEKGPSVAGASPVDVRIGRASILAVSGDESTLAATVGAEVYFFSIPKLLDKDQEPLFSCKVNESCTIKDFKWQKETKNFLLLSNHGLLSHGSMGAQLKDVLDNVDAADWSIEGDFVAIARKNALSILSSNFDEQHSMALLFQSWPTDSGCTIKVDSVKWVREDSIIIGCFRMNGDNSEEGYLVQVITSREHKLSEVPCKAVIYSFPDIFDGIMDDILPTGGGPYLLMSYLDCWELILASNQKAIDQHVLLLKWSVDDDGKVVFLEFSNDKYTPRIDLQENGDDNIILGFGVDKFSLYEKVTIKVDSDLKELSPRCVLSCLTIEGKLIMYYAARLSEPSDIHQTFLSPDDHSFVKEKPFTLNSSGVESIKATSTLTDYVEGAPSDNKLKQISNVEPDTRRDQSEVLRENTAGKNREADGSQLGVLTGQVTTFNKSSPELPYLQVSGSVIRSEVKSGPQTVKSFAEHDLSANSSACSTTSVEAAARHVTKDTIEAGEVGKGVLKSTDTTGSTFGMQSTRGVLNSTGTTGATFGMQPTRKIFGGDGFTANHHSVIASSRPVLNVAEHGSISNQFQSSGQLFNAKGSNRDQPPSMFSSNKAPVNEHSAIASSGSVLNVAQQSSFSTQLQSSGQLSHANSSGKDQPSFMFSSNKAPQYEEHTESLPRPGNVVHTIRDSPSLAQQGSLLSKSQHRIAQPLLENIRASSLPQMLDSEPKLSKQFYDVKDMAKELDTLLSFIEREGGFRDVCTVFQKSSLSALENGLEHLSQISRICKKKTEEQLLEIQQLQNKKLQVSARQIYMEGVVEQASNEKYQDIWNQQKLSPEFEVKWQHILNLHQNLTNQLIELERHFNNLELNRFGESGRVPKGRKSYQNSLQPSRQIQSFHSVYNTLNSQLAAAEHLSECLSTQMSMLNVSSPPVKKQNVAKELLESIGLPHEAIVFQSPDCKRVGLTPTSIKRTSTSSAIDEYQRRNTASALKSFEPETARRTLGKSWASFEPPKTTVKRIAQEERIRVGADKPFSKAKGAYDSQLEAFAVRQKNNATPAYFSSGSSLNEGVEESSVNQVSESRSVFRWAKDASDLSQSQGPNSRLMQVTQKTTSHLSSSVVPSPSVFSSPQSNTKMLFTSPDRSGFGSTHLGIQSNPFGAKSLAYASTPTSSMLPSSIPPMMTRSTVEAKGQASKNLNLKMGESVVSTSVPRSMKQFSDNLKSTSATNESTITPFLSLPLSSNISGNTAQFAESATQNKSTESAPMIEAHSRALDSTPSNISFPFSKPLTSASGPATLPLAASLSRTPFGNSSVSTKGAEASNLITPTFTSADSSPSPLSSSIKFSQSQKSVLATTARTSTSTSLPSITSGGPTVGSKPVGQTDQVALVSTSISDFSVSSTSSPQSSQSQKLLFPTTLSLSSPSQSPTSLSNVANSRTEQSSLVAPASESTKSEPATPQAPAIEEVAVTRKESNLSPTNTGSISLATPSFKPEIPSTSTPTLGATTTEKDGGLDAAFSQEDEMEEEAPDVTTSLSLGTFGGFGHGSTPSSAPKSNPFGGSFLTSTSTMSTPTIPASPGETFRPASFSLPSAQPAQASQPVNPVAFSGGLGGGYSGFGQPAQLGVGQQALGSVLGAFGQSRQLGAGMPGVGLNGGLSPTSNVAGFASANVFSSTVTGGGFTSVASAGGGFAAAAKGGGFASAPSFGGGFAGAATGGGFAGSTTGGVFAGAATGGGFAGSTTGGGFAGAATGGGFGSASGGFGAFNSNQVGGFSSFGAGAGKPPAELLTQMRK